MNPFPILAEIAIYGSNRAIENQEAEGQRSLINSTVLPVKSNTICGHEPSVHELLKEYGVEFKEVVDGDPLFQYVILPTGWKKEATGHSMWSYLLDDKGRRRASIFYKAAYYDRDAFMNPERRFSVEKDYKLADEGFSQYHVKDGETSVFATEKIKHENPEDYMARSRVDDSLMAEAKAWIEAKYPDWKNPAAYWDEP